MRILICALCLVCLVLGSESANAIVGGTDANWRKYPWLAQNVCLYPGQTEWTVCGCSSTVIHPFYAVTAAHCLNGPHPFKVGLRFPDGDVIEVVEEIRHPNFSRDSGHTKFTFGVVSESVADIGLQRLAKRVRSAGGEKIFDIFNDKRSSGNNNIVGDLAKVLGWGATDPAVPPDGFSPTLQQIDEVVQDNAECQSLLDFIAEFSSGGLIRESPFRFNDSLICAAPPGVTVTFPPPAGFEPAGVCDGDAGGALFTTGAFHRLHSKTRPKKVLGFVTDTLALSLQSQCGNGIDIYTRLTPAYVDWIRSVVSRRR